MTTILSGNNDFLRRQALAKLESDYVSEFGDFGLEKLDGQEVSFDQVHASLASVPLFVDKKMVILRDASANKDITERIDQLLSAVSDTVEFVIVESKLDKRGSYYKTLQKQQGFKDFGDPDDSTLTNWLVSLTHEQGGALSQSDARYLIDRAGHNQSLLSNELDKLLLYQPKISRENIDLLVESSPRSTIFELLEVAFAGNLKRALQLYQEQRQLRVEPQAILALIAWQLHILALIKSAGDRSASDIAREAGISPYVVSKSLSIARRLSAQNLKDLVHASLILDVRLKSEPIDADNALQNLLVTITKQH